MIWEVKLGTGESKTKGSESLFFSRMRRNSKVQVQGSLEDIQVGGEGKTHEGQLAERLLVVVGAGLAG